MSFGPFFVGEIYTFTFTIKDKDTGAAVNLTGQTAKVHLRKRGATTNKYSGADEDAVLDADPTTGKITYTLPDAWATADVSGWTLQVRLTQGAVVRRTEKINFPVESGL